MKDSTMIYHSKESVSSLKLTSQILEDPALEIKLKSEWVFIQSSFRSKQVKQKAKVLELEPNEELLVLYLLKQFLFTQLLTKYTESMNNGWSF